MINFKYYLNINQYAAFNLFGNKIDYIDLVIYDFIKDFTKSKGRIEMIYKNETYFKISRNLIMDNLPLLNIKTKQGISNRIEKLIELEILDRYENNQKEGVSFYKYGNNFDKMTFTPINESLHPINESLQVPINKTLQGANLIDTPINESLHPPINESLHDNNNNNNKEIIDKEINNKYIFSDSNFFDFKKFDKALKKVFKSEENIDFKYYYNRFINHKTSKTLEFTNEEWLTYFQSAILSIVKKDDGFVRIVKEHLFSDSIYINNFDLFYKHSQSVLDSFPNVDIKFYFESIRDYETPKGYKKTNWIKVLSTWIRNDIKRNDKYKEISQKEQMKTTKTNPYEHMTPDEIRQIQIENGSLGAPKYRRSMVADPKQGHINEIGDIFDGILNGLKK